jgi:hypothetical protein
MKLSPLAAAACSLTLSLATAQTPGVLKRVTAVPANGRPVVLLTALSIERGTPYPSTVNLKRNVEIRTPVCLPMGKQGAMVCDGDMILRADAAVFHEATGEIEAQGNVTVTPLQHK